MSDTLELWNEYDFSEGIRGKYVERYRQGTQVVVLEPDRSRPPAESPEGDVK